MSSKKNILQRQGEIRKLMEDLDRDINEHYSQERIAPTSQENDVSINIPDTFCLLEERNKWCNKWIMNGRLTGRAMAELKETDNKFIRLLKERIKDMSCDDIMDYYDNCNFYDFVKVIDKLVGKELTSNSQETKPIIGKEVSLNDGNSLSKDKTPDTFCLSKLGYWGCNSSINEKTVYTEEDVKEFIRLLKDYVEVSFNQKEVLEAIDKLAGQKLLSNSQETKSTISVTGNCLSIKDKTPDNLLNLSKWEHISDCEYRRLKREFPKTYHGFTSRIAYQYYKKVNK
jgi:hypothetical protein